MLTSYNKEVGITKKTTFPVAHKRTDVPTKEVIKPQPSSHVSFHNKDVGITKEPISCSSQKTRCPHKKSL